MALVIGIIIGIAIWSLLVFILTLVNVIDEDWANITCCGIWAFIFVIVALPIYKIWKNHKRNKG